MKKIAFLGSANALGMMYAIELRKQGFKVTYIVTTPRSDTLSRPEFHYPELHYPYDEWIKEKIITNPILANLFANQFLGDLIKLLNNHDLVVLSGYYLMLANHLKCKKIAFLSYGSDLDVWCNKSNYRLHASNAVKFKKPIRSIASLLAIKKMRSAFKKCNLLITFPMGLSKERDDILIENSKNWNGETIYRFDISFHPLINADRSFVKNNEKLVLLCAARCSFIPEKDSSPSDMKGIDIILKGIAKYAKCTKSIFEFHIIEKGKDLQETKNLATELGINNVIVWHKEMPFVELVKLYEKSHICFDQTSNSWLGAIGLYALYLGRPLIANSRKDILNEIWHNSSSVCEAQTPDEVADWLYKLENPSLREKIHFQSMKFAEDFLGPDLVLQKIVRYLD